VRLIALKCGGVGAARVDITLAQDVLNGIEAPLRPERRPGGAQEGRGEGHCAIEAGGQRWGRIYRQSRR